MIFTEKQKDNHEPALTPEEQQVIGDAEAIIERIQEHRRAVTAKVNQAQRALHEAEAAQLQDFEAGDEPRDLTPERNALRDVEADLRATGLAVQKADERFQRVQGEVLAGARARFAADHALLVAAFEHALESAAKLSRKLRDFQNEANRIVRPLGPGYALALLHWREFSANNIGSDDDRDSRFASWKQEKDAALNPKKKTPDGTRIIRLLKSLPGEWSNVRKGQLWPPQVARPWPEGMPSPETACWNPGEVIGVPGEAAKALVKHKFAEYVEAS